MSESKPVRTIEVINAEYGQLCAKLGHAVYSQQIHMEKHYEQDAAFHDEIKALQEQLKSLNQEATALSKGPKNE